MAELADAQRSGRCDRKVVGVRLSPRAPNDTSARESDGERRVGVTELAEIADIYKKPIDYFLK